MKRALAIIFLAYVLGPSLVRAEVVERIVAKVNGRIITKTQLDKEYQMLIERLGPAPTPEEEQRRRTELRLEVLDSMIDTMLILQIAEERGLQVPPRYFQEWKENIKKEMNLETEEDFLRAIEIQGLTEADLQANFERNLLTQEIRRMEVENKINIAQPEIEKYYREHITDYTEPSKVRIREVVVKFEAGGEAEAEQRARRLLQDIQQGADFAEVARRHSDASSKEAGGDLGFFEQRELAEPLAAVAFEMAPGDISDLIRMDTSFRIIRVEEKTEEKTMTLDSVYNDIGNALRDELLQEQTEKFLKLLREQAIVEIRI